MYSGCAAALGPLGDGDGDGGAEGVDDACIVVTEAFGIGETLGDGVEVSVAVNAMMARSGTDASIRSGVAGPT
jgi:hypothetical protein